MLNISLSLWLVISVICFPQFGEALYAPALPKIASSLMISKNMVEQTTSFFLFGFALGIAFWGYCSDRIGRRPALLISLVLYSLGCIGCMMSNSLTSLMIARFVKAFGGSACSGISQAIARDLFDNQQRNKLFSWAGIIVSLMVGTAPIIGGAIIEHFIWSGVFLLLFILSFILEVYLYFYLPETNGFLKSQPKNKFNFIQGFEILMKDKTLLSLVILMGIANGYLYCFYSEGSFYFIELLKLRPSQYGVLFFIISIGFAAGSLYSKRLYAQKLNYIKILIVPAVFCWFLQVCGWFLLYIKF